MTKAAPDATPPEPIKGLTTRAYYSSAMLNWEEPVELDYKETHISYAELQSASAVTGAASESTHHTRCSDIPVPGGATITVEKGMYTTLVPNLENGKNYCFFVTAVDESGNKSKVETVMTKPEGSFEIIFDPILADEKGGCRANYKQLVPANDSELKMAVTVEARNLPPGYYMSLIAGVDPGTEYYVTGGEVAQTKEDENLHIQMFPTFGQADDTNSKYALIAVLTKDYWKVKTGPKHLMEKQFILSSASKPVHIEKINTDAIRDGSRK